VIVGWVLDAVEVGSPRRETSVVLCDNQLATLVRGGSAVTAHCHAATALLTREYQGEYRRQALPSATSSVHTFPPHACSDGGARRSPSSASPMG